MRKFLLILDDSQECLNAMRFAAMRAARTGGGVEVLAVIPPEEFNHWIGVSDIRRSEARERIEVHFEVFAKWRRERQGIDPELVIREGEPIQEILAQVKDDPEIGVLVLGAGTDKKGPGPLVTQLTKNAGSLPIPMTIVPGMPEAVALTLDVSDPDHDHTVATLYMPAVLDTGEDEEDGEEISPDVPTASDEADAEESDES